jgi:hypothetical protein
MGQNWVWDGSSGNLILGFYNADGEPDVPDQITYRIKCETNGVEIKEETEVTPDEVVTIRLTSSENALINPSNRFEVRSVTVKAGYGADDDEVRKFPYLVKNLACPAQFLPDGVYVGWADDIGFGHEDDYTKITGE